MRFITINLTIVCCIFLFGCGYNAHTIRYKVPEYDTRELESYVQKMDNTFDALGFKGIHLGMTKTQVNQVVQNTPWGYIFATKNYISYNGYYKDAPQYKDYNIIGRDLSAESAFWVSMGCKDNEGRKECYDVRFAALYYKENKLDKLIISSPTWSLDEIKTGFADWCEAAYQSLHAKYGLPTKITQHARPFKLFTIKSGYEAPLYLWKFKTGECIEIRAFEHEMKLYCSVIFQLEIRP